MSLVFPDWRDAKKVMLKKDQVHIWLVQLDLPDNDINEMEKMLSAGEKERAERFYFLRDRKRHIATHGALRKVLSLYVKVHPALLNFFTNQYGKPYLEPAEEDSQVPQFNISHSHGLALFALVKDGMIGVDVEKINPDFATMEIAERFFSTTEVNELRSLKGREQIAGFFNCWTRKEAYIKARGMGLSLPLNQFDVELDPRKKAKIVASNFCSQDIGRLSMHAFKVQGDFVGALVVEGHDPSIEFYQYGGKLK